MHACVHVFIVIWVNIPIHVGLHGHPNAVPSNFRGYLSNGSYQQLRHQHTPKYPPNYHAYLSILILLWALVLPEAESSSCHEASTLPFTKQRFAHVQCLCSESLNQINFQPTTFPFEASWLEWIKAQSFGTISLCVISSFNIQYQQQGNFCTTLADLTFFCRLEILLKKYNSQYSSNEMLKTIDLDLQNFADSKLSKPCQLFNQKRLVSLACQFRWPHEPSLMTLDLHDTMVLWIIRHIVRDLSLFPDSWLPEISFGPTLEPAVLELGLQAVYHSTCHKAN